MCRERSILLLQIKIEDFTNQHNFNFLVTSYEEILDLLQCRNQTTFILRKNKLWRNLDFLMRRNILINFLETYFSLQKFWLITAFHWENQSINTIRKTYTKMHSPEIIQLLTSLMLCCVPLLPSSSPFDDIRHSDLSLSVLVHLRDLNDVLSHEWTIQIILKYNS